MAMEITQFLVAAQSDDARVRNGAEGSLIQFQDHHLPHFLLSLSFALANDDKPVESRQLAGLLLKNSLAKAIDTVIKSQIKDLLPHLPWKQGILRRKLSQRYYANLLTRHNRAQFADAAPKTDDGSYSVRQPSQSHANRKRRRPEASDRRSERRNVDYRRSDA
ncbi:unnamed protein product [Arabis nemorensis]|uniref:Importin N-terminal domain-containing protein n=1 Tax=Arabis nemorensis TaxID=586526 RepID=A0A565C7L4_9BRAS|nr:unnamed protein product [Arabis nemorensis]